MNDEFADLLDSDSAASALRALVAPAARGPVARIYRHYRPLGEAVTDFVNEAQDFKRIYTGVVPFDEQMRGVGGGHLCVYVGYSHSGKTQLFLHTLGHNKTKRVALFIPDEPATLVLAKLASLVSGVDAQELEARVSQGDERTITLLRGVASEEFPNLAVFDQPLTPGDMERAYDEVEDVWGEKCDMIALDYVELLQAGETVQQKFDYIKAFGSRRRTPTFALHQTSRTAGAEGRSMTISSGAYGGEQHATFMIGIRRKKASLTTERNEQRVKYERTGSESALERIEALEYELKIHEYTLTANLVKNKRPGGGLIDEVDFEIMAGTGGLMLLREGELPDQYLAINRAEREQREAARAAASSYVPPTQQEEMF